MYVWLNEHVRWGVCVFFSIQARDATQIEAQKKDRKNGPKILTLTIVHTTSFSYMWCACQLFSWLAANRQKFIQFNKPLTAWSSRRQPVASLRDSCTSMYTVRVCHAERLFVNWLLKSFCFGNIHASKHDEIAMTRQLRVANEKTQLVPFRSPLEIY